MLGDGCFAIYWPQDGHMPCFSANGAETVKKVVVKVEFKLNNHKDTVDFLISGKKVVILQK